MTLASIPRATLGEGLRIVNFSTPHTCFFSDGSVLMKCQSERAKLLKPKKEVKKIPGKKGTTRIRVKYFLTTIIRKELDRLENDEAVDSILVPRELMEALRNDWKNNGRVGKCVVAVPGRRKTNGRLEIRHDVFEV